MIQLSDSLWRWTAPQPNWRPGMEGPGGWERDVASVAYRTTDTVILIDHQRSGAEVAARYDATVFVGAAGLGRVAVPAVRASQDGDVIGGAQILQVAGVDEGEIVVWLAAERTLVAAEVLTGTGEGLRVAESPALRSRSELRAWLAGLAELPVDLVRGRHEIRAALAQAPW